MSFIQKFRPRKYILDSSVFMHSCQTAVSNYISHDHDICIKHNCLFPTSYNTLKNLRSLEKLIIDGKIKAFFFLRNSFVETFHSDLVLKSWKVFVKFCVTQHLFQKCFTKCLTDLFDDVTQNCHFLCFSLKQKFFFMNRFIVPNLVNL